jgi:putative ABC transport system ATP-binding protein/lipoprotein-releasing system ATP-binding protein
MMEAIQGINIKKSFGDPPQEILKGINVNIAIGDYVALIGKSGSGKSTLLYILSGLDVPTEGKVLIDGVDFFHLNSEEMHKFRNEKMGFVFQFHYLLPELNALENITMPARKQGNHNKKAPYALYLMEEFGLLHCKNKTPYQMSGGEMQRVAIARALIQEPQFIFADEPTGNLDSINGDKVIDIFKKINKENKTTIVFVTHDPDYAASASRRIYMQDGMIAKED